MQVRNGSGYVKGCCAVNLWEVRNEAAVLGVLHHR